MNSMVPPFSAFSINPSVNVCGSGEAKSLVEPLSRSKDGMTCEKDLKDDFSLAGSGRRYEGLGGFATTSMQSVSLKICSSCTPRLRNGVGSSPRATRVLHQHWHTARRRRLLRKITVDRRQNGPTKHFACFGSLARCEVAIGRHFHQQWGL
jgi:hypothetical protein